MALRALPVLLFTVPAAGSLSVYTHLPFTDNFFVALLANSVILIKFN
jgi:hypothetical protein